MEDGAAEQIFFKLTIWRHNRLIIIRHDFFLIILTFNLKLDTRFGWGGFQIIFLSHFIYFIGI